MKIKNHYIKPNWSAPLNVHAITTTRHHGNMANAKNKKQLCKNLELPNKPIWLKQVHKNNVICADRFQSNIADASFSHSVGTVCAILTADCLPILLCDKDGTSVAAVHGGWRSLKERIIENTIQAFDIPPKNLLVWLGPAISPKAFIVGEEVYEEYKYYLNTKIAFKKNNKNKWLADIYAIAKQILIHYGINNIYGGDFCTYTDSDYFFSYRRDGAKTGRMASLIWLTK